MTDRFKGAWVAFDEDLREDDMAHLYDAIRQLRHVAAVEPSPTSPHDWMARERVRVELARKLLDVLEKKGP